MDARHLPGSWSSTANALECQAYYACNAAFVVDDFVPVGTSWQVRAYQTSADKIIRSQGNQSGRARLSDTANLQTAYYPRGIIMSTGEDTPEGHSVRARLLILELSPGDIRTEQLTICQKMRKLFPAAMKALIQSLCINPVEITERAERIRNENITTGHTRTPPMLGRLIATAEATLTWARKAGYLDARLETTLVTEMQTSILAAGAAQRSYLRDRRSGRNIPRSPTAGSRSEPGTPKNGERRHTTQGHRDRMDRGEQLQRPTDLQKPRALRRLGELGRR